MSFKVLLGDSEKKGFLPDFFLSISVSLPFFHLLNEAFTHAGAIGD